MHTRHGVQIPAVAPFLSPINRLDYHIRTSIASYEANLLLESVYRALSNSRIKGSRYLQRRRRRRSSRRRPSK